jgi:hypothetical protein
MVGHGYFGVLERQTDDDYSAPHCIFFRSAALRSTHFSGSQFSGSHFQRCLKTVHQLKELYKWIVASSRIRCNSTVMKERARRKVRELLGFDLALPLGELASEHLAKICRRRGKLIKRQAHPSIFMPWHALLLTASVPVDSPQYIPLLQF